MLRWGTNESAQGPIKVGLSTLDASRKWDGLGFGRVAIDFNHNTVPGHASYRGEPAPIAAMATPRVIPAEGLVFEEIAWTPDGRANRAHYPDLSPAVKLDDSGEVIFCHSAALARNGAVKDLHLFSAGTGASMNAIDRDVMQRLGLTEAQWLRHAPARGSRLTTLSASMLSPQLRENLLSLFGLHDDATDDDILQALAKLETAIFAEEAKRADQEHAQKLAALAGDQSRGAVEESVALRASIEAMKGAQQRQSEIDAVPMQTLSARFTATISAEDLVVMATLRITPDQWRRHAA